MNPAADLSVRLHDWLCARREPPLFCVSTPEELADLPNTLPESGPVLGVSVKFPHILKPHTLALFQPGIVNLHNSFLPWNRGKHTNVWPLIDGSPAGVTLHWMDEGVDTGPLLAQDLVPTYPWDTAETLYRRLDDSAFRLFTDHWEHLGILPHRPQPAGGSVHKRSELATLDEFATTSWRDVINQLRARTYSGYPGVRFRVGDHTVEATINLKRVA